MTRPVPSVDQYMTRLPLTISSSSLLSSAHKLMREHQIRHLPVVDDGTLVGMLSMRDLHLIESLTGVDPSAVPIDDAMTSPPVTVAPGEKIDKVAAKMANEKLGSVLVVADGEVQGIFTTIDALIALFHTWKTTP